MITAKTVRLRPLLNFITRDIDSLYADNEYVGEVVDVNTGPDSHDIDMEVSMPKGPDLKRALQADFGPAREASSKRRKAEETVDRREAYGVWLPKLGNTCGYCLAEEADHTDYNHHRIQMCPLASDVVRGLMYDLSKAIRYPPKAYTCFKCHISSMGNDSLHPEFGRGIPCRNPNLVLPFAIHLFTSATHRDSFYRVTGITLDESSTGSIQAFASLFCAKNSTYGTFGMAVIAWIYAYMEENDLL